MRFRPPIGLLFNWLMAFCASSSVAISTNANPRARPVAMSRITLTESTVPADASLLYARNVYNLLMLLWNKKTRELAIPEQDEVVAGTLLTHAGAIRAPQIAALLADTAVRV